MKKAIVKKTVKKTPAKKVVAVKKVKIIKDDCITMFIKSQLKGSVKKAADSLKLDFSKTTNIVIFDKSHMQDVSSEYISHNDLKKEYLKVYSLLMFAYLDVKATLISEDTFKIKIVAKNRRKI